MTNVTVVIGAGSIGQAIARRVSAGRHVVLADLRQENADAAARTLGDAGFDVSTAVVDVSSRETRSATSPPSSWVLTARLSPAATSSWMVGSRPPTGSGTWHPNEGQK